MRTRYEVSVLKRALEITLCTGLLGPRPAQWMSRIGRVACDEDAVAPANFDAAACDRHQAPSFPPYKLTRAGGLEQSGTVRL